MAENLCYTAMNKFKAKYGINATGAVGDGTEMKVADTVKEGQVVAAMSSAVSGLRDVPEFQNLFIMFKNPILGVLAGALLTAVIQSSSASVGILQALAITGQISMGAAIW